MKSAPEVKLEPMSVKVMLKTKPNQSVGLIAMLGFPLLLVGCAAEPVPEAFEPNLVQTMKYQITKEIPMDQASVDTDWVVTTMFGTPDEPRLPEVVVQDPDLSQIVSMENLMKASGPEHAEGRGLYRLLCSTCHGVTGNGRGQSAAAQTPYPRDYRMGIFKFKTTPRGAKPTKEDLRRLIKHGIAGTNMQSVEQLLVVEGLARGPAAAAWLPKTITDEDVDALVDYVIYLSWRGELERRQIDMGIFEEILTNDERLIDSDYGRQIGWADRESRQAFEDEIDQLSGEEEDSLSESAKERLQRGERFLEDWGYAEDNAADIGDAWLEAEDEVIVVPDPPADLPLAESYADVLKFRNSDQAEAFNASVDRGRELFVSKNTSCSKCHGEQGLGNGQTTDYDDWTKDWTDRVGLKPDNLDALIPLLARGALPPVNAVPRNFAEGIFRGGSSSKDLFLRITQGIDGSPMPKATYVEGQFEEQDVWHLINFIRSLQTEEASAPPETETAEEPPLKSA